MSNIDIARLLLDPPEDKVAIKPPVKCQENKVFVIDKKAPCFHNPDDWKADDLGVFKNDGTHVIAYYEDKDPEIRFISKTKPEDCKRSTILLKRTYWTHAKHPDFRRTAHEILRYDGHVFTPEQFVLLQYSFCGNPHAITTKPHGNYKSGKAFTRTKPGVLESIKGKVKGSVPPSQVYDEVFEEAGCLFNVCSLSDVPRNRKQVENANYKGKETRSQDELYDLTLKSKEEEEVGKVYIRRLQVAPSPACVLASDSQVQDVKQFCAKDFDAKLESLENVWNSREKKSRGTVLSNSSEAEFHKYFVANVADDMKKKMISPFRKRACLWESFFSNNRAE